MILGKRIYRTVVGTCIELNDTLIELAHVDGIICFDVLIKVKQKVVLHIHLSCIGMHPEYIGHLAAAGTCLEQCPVVIPVNYIDSNLNA